MDHPWPSHVITVVVTSSTGKPRPAVKQMTHHDSGEWSPIAAA